MTPALSLRELRKTYKNGQAALQGIDLQVQHGDFFALLGPNGAGKSTTIGIISSLVNKTSGKVWVYGHDIDTEFAQAKSCIGLVPQEFNFNIFEPVMEIVVNQAGYYGLPRQLALEHAEKYLSQLGLWERRHDPARTLSGGMKRRLMIARALVHEPKLLILDEPTAGVDVEIRHSMWAFLEQLNARGTTIILTTHYLEEAERLCRNIAIIDHGRVIECCSMRRLLAQLNTHTLVLELVEELQGAPEIPGFTTRLVDSHTVEADVDKGRTLNALFAGLSEARVQVSGMRAKSNRLEQWFLHLIGNGGSEEGKS